MATRQTIISGEDPASEPYAGRAKGVEGILKTGHPDGRFHLGCDSLTTVKDPGGWRAEITAGGDDRA